MTTARCNKIILYTVLITHTLLLPTISSSSQDPSYEAQANKNDGDYNAEKYLGKCSICLESLYTKDETIKSVPYTLSCGHIFHIGCVKTWATDDASCPLCRATIGPEILSTSESIERERQVRILQKFLRLTSKDAFEENKEKIENDKQIAMLLKERDCLFDQQKTLKAQYQKSQQRITYLNDLLLTTRTMCDSLNRESQRLSKKCATLIKDKSKIAQKTDQLSEHARQLSLTSKMLKTGYKKIERENLQLKKYLLAGISTTTSLIAYYLYTSHKRIATS